MGRAEVKRGALFVVSCMVLAAGGVILFVSLGSLMQTADRVRHSVNVKAELAGVVLEMSNAESGQRGYLLTSDIAYLDPYYSASSTIDARLGQLRGLVSDNPEQVATVGRIAGLVSQKFDEMSQTVRLQSTGQTDAAADLVRQNRGRAIARAFLAEVTRMEAAEELLLQGRQQEETLARRAALATSAGFVLTTMLLLASLYYLGRRDLRRRAGAAQELAAVAAQLHSQARELTRERNEVAQLNEASNFLQSCGDMREISSLLGPFLQKLFPGQAGAVHAKAASRNRLDPLAAWGAEEGAVAPFMPQECWGLRRGQLHSHSRDDVAPACMHFPDATRREDTLCIPLVAHGETLGLLSLASRRAEEGADGGLPQTRRFAEMVARQLGLTLANIGLRESLKEQTIRDPMTRAFNRRYLEVVAEKETARAERFNHPMVVAMLDIDHFKRFNDSHGHQAGDAALVAVCQYLQANIRDTDWLFRYGGEEFLLLMADADCRDAFVRLEALRAAVADLAIGNDGILYPKVTISCGIAGWREHGERFEDVVAAADEALYRAKKAGRNRVAVAEPPSAATIAPGA